MALERPFCIMHVILEPRHSGAEILVRDLVRIHRSEGHRTSIVAFKPSQEDFVPEIRTLEANDCALFVPENSLARWGRVSWIRAAVKRVRPDIIFAHSILPSLYTRLALRLTRRPPIVTVLHTDDDLGDPALRRVEQFLWKRNACLVGVSPNSVANYQRRMAGRVPTRVIPNGIRVEQFAQAKHVPSDVRNRLYQAKEDEIIALQIGRICLQKQQHVSVEALARLNARGTGNIRLVLVGPSQDADYEAKVVNCAREGGVADRVQFAGPQRNVAEWLAGADIFLMPSGWEAHSIAALEGMASGLPCVFTAIDSFEAWRSYPGVWMIGVPPAGDELAACLETMVKSGARARRYERDLGAFSIHRCAEEYLRLIEEFTQRASGMVPTRSVTAKGTSRGDP